MNRVPTGTMVDCLSSFAAILHAVTSAWPVRQPKWQEIIVRGNSYFACYYYYVVLVVSTCSACVCVRACACVCVCVCVCICMQSYGSGLIASGDVSTEVEASFSDEPDGRGTAVDWQRTKVARERLQAKIARIMDQIRVEQSSKEGQCHLYSCVYGTD